MPHYLLPSPRQHEIHFQMSASSPPPPPSISFETEATDCALSPFILGGNLASSHSSYHRSYQCDSDILPDSSSPLGLPSGNYPHPPPESFGLDSSDNINHDAEYLIRYQQQSQSFISSETGVNDTSLTLAVDSLDGRSGTTPHGLCVEIPESANLNDMLHSPTSNFAWSSDDVKQSPMSLGDSASSVSILTPASPTRFPTPWSALPPGLPGNDASQEFGGYHINASNRGMNAIARSSIGNIMPSYPDEDYDRTGLEGDSIYNLGTMHNPINHDHSDFQGGQCLYSTAELPVKFTPDMSDNSQGLTVDTTPQGRIPKKRTSVASGKVKERARSKRKMPGRGQYTCEICGDDLTAAHNLKNHINSHKGIKPYPCTMCCYSSCTSYTLKRHILKKHRDGGASTSRSRG
ncbi:hypothetical protein VKT23_018842 [Stygiomarasmius scandens]|uniref:C2H2-type domain-containing protein n=1 Tax=Marasmiellus scandens TaxID=2682957 RepID=A0ABR1IRH7_9AGAR